MAIPLAHPSDSGRPNMQPTTNEHGVSIQKLIPYTTTAATCGMNIVTHAAAQQN